MRTVSSFPCNVPSVGPQAPWSLGILRFCSTQACQYFRSTSKAHSAGALAGLLFTWPGPSLCQQNGERLARSPPALGLFPPIGPHPRPTFGQTPFWPASPCEHRALLSLSVSVPLVSTLHVAVAGSEAHIVAIACITETYEHVPSHSRIESKYDQRI